ncbi:MAG: LacI family DNA-binding transcriptional regulator [Comamonas sp.]
MSAPLRPATIQDVARLAGVSPMTVSRALNAPDKLAPETLQRVRDAIAQTRYVPNAMASGLRLSRARLVAAMLPTLTGPVFQEMVQSLDRALHQLGYQLMVGCTGYDSTHEAELLRAVIQRRPDGIIMTGLAATEAGRAALLASGIPVVETWDHTDTPIDMLVGFSHTAIGMQVAQYLADRGHRQLAVISADDARARSRIQAFREHAQALGLPPVTVFLTEAPSTLGAGRRGLDDVLRREPATTAVFCSSDTLALGALIEAQAQGRAVPQSLAVMGMGDQEFASTAPPPLTTVRLDGTRIGQLAAEMVVSRAEGRPVAQQRVDLGFSIVTRSSA